ncbi:MAG: UDP-2,4-diacetamido-2,4,6-trideoxy-beta-L-altropyranose hydrolase [Bacillus sp. (in: Bacteria)]|nr:UDP-2,4-diacetamido-2,4,6-trideoxy-beta-L-altropyranose hydrolase [Bacillus sp. (in: firmicutes)]MCM1427814.1 UDP-2,4-diacetamido-2,4,6-trideoxy-beta-L-altropyranose hydrolase [Eubacterium sp.]
MPAVYFRTDGNEKIATGHIMRCLSIARACNALHMQCRFIVSDETSVSLLQERFTHPDEFPISCLHSNYKDMESELPILQPILKDASWLFIDSYFVTPSYLATLQNYCHTAYLDDMMAFDYPVDLIVNYDIEPQNMPSCYLNIPYRLIGASYTPLREQFQNAAAEVRPDIHDIFLSTGGTDAYNAAGNILTKIFTPQPGNSTALFDTALQNCRYHVVTSRLNAHYQELVSLSRSYPVIHIYENVQDMAALMGKCDLAVCAGGTTLYELCAVGITSISFATADNQLNAVETFSRKHVIPYAGDIRSAADDTIGHIVTFLHEHSHSYEKRKECSLRMKTFIDGGGSARIARALTEHI